MLFDVMSRLHQSDKVYGMALVCRELRRVVKLTATALRIVSESWLTPEDLQKTLTEFPNARICLTCLPLAKVDLLRAPGLYGRLHALGINCGPGNWPSVRKKAAGNLRAATSLTSFELTLMSVLDEELLSHCSTSLSRLTITWRGRAPWAPKPSSLSHLTNLSSLSLSNISGYYALDCVRGLSSLEQLRIEAQPGVCLRCLAGLDRLKQLRLRMPRGRLVPDFFACLSNYCRDNLQVLDLQVRGVPTSFAWGLAACTSLRFLQIHRMEKPLLLSGVLHGLPELQYCWIWGRKELAWIEVQKCSSYGRLCYTGFYHWNPYRGGD